VLLEDVQVPDATSRYGEWRLENSLKKFGGVETIQDLGHRASKVRSGQLFAIHSLRIGTISLSTSQLREKSLLVTVAGEALRSPNDMVG
jgi:hypothetical protein